jgi:hypothetical protein
MRQVIGVMGFIALTTACGQVTVKLVEPKPKEIMVGQKGHFVLDKDESSAAIRSGTLDVEVTSVDDMEVGLQGKAAVKTLIGPKDFTVASTLEAGILTREWLAQLRDVKTYQAKKALITYSGLSADACDIVKLSDIVGYPNLAIEPTVCLQTRTIPSVAVYVEESGQTFTAFFRADE